MRTFGYAQIYYVGVYEYELILSLKGPVTKESALEALKMSHLRFTFPENPEVVSDYPEILGMEPDPEIECWDYDELFYILLGPSKERVEEFQEKMRKMESGE